MKDEKGNVKELEEKKDVFGNIKTSVKKSFGALFNSFDSVFKNSEKKEQVSEQSDKYEIKMTFEYPGETEVNYEYTEPVEPLEKRIEKNVNKIILLEELSKLRSNMSSIEERLIETANSELDNEEKEKIVLSLKDEMEELDEIYNETIEPNISIIEEDVEFEKLQISKLLQMCDEELTHLNKYKSLELEGEAEIIHAIIEENLKEQTKDIDSLRERVKAVEYSNKRYTLVTEIHNFLSKTIDIGYNLLPSSISQNKPIGVVVTTVVLNNRIRNMRKVMRKENEDIKFIKYNSLMSEIKDEKTCISKAEELLDDAAQQVDRLKQEFIMEFYYDMDRYEETEDIMVEFSSIEYEITSKKLELEETSTIEEI